ncbi:hypothetical protein PHJA_002855600 [Phtheirospermum japonicum]|uniref:Uncharacterized protein n=1 Tax=Phtheirospermum japonicum TaxID=374723 RepID=A0A830DFA3_9LAMI|nr:hypothetical protein PHJA_002855600 [Phtheirospermum japonicum]
MANLLHSESKNKKQGSKQNTVELGNEGRQMNSLAGLAATPNRVDIIYGLCNLHTFFGIFTNVKLFVSASC